MLRKSNQKGLELEKGAMCLCSHGEEQFPTQARQQGDGKDEAKSQTRTSDEEDLSASLAGMNTVERQSA